MVNRSFPALKSPAVLSPMAGVTDVAFRALAKQYGAGLTYTEFISSAGLVRGSDRTLSMAKVDPSERPVAVQLFGNSVDEVVRAAQIVEKKFDIIDVNCGCPAWKVIKTGAGSAMLKNPKLIAKFVSTLVDGVRKPVTVKIRIGVDDNNINAVHVARLVEESGAAAIAVHGRTQKQGYGGVANWDIIKKVKDSVTIPVIGNGDVFTPEIFAQRLNESGVDAIMIARGALGNPYIFTQITDYLKKGSYEYKSGIEQFFDLLPYIEKHHLPFSFVKSHAIQFTKGIVGGATLRNQLSSCQTVDEICSFMEKARARRFLNDSRALPVKLLSSSPVKDTGFSSL